MKPQIRYARTSDGVDIAYATVGNGPPLLVLRSFLTPDVGTEIGLEPSRRAPWLELARSRTVVIWDHRGSGLSGPADEYTLDHALLDLEAVADQAGGQRFDMLTMLSPSHFAIAYTVRHPERVGRLVLQNPGPPGGSMRSVAGAELPDIALTHFSQYASLFALSIFGWERPDEARVMVRFLTKRYTGETWTRLNESIEAIDATPLAVSVTSPTLILIDLNAGNPELVRPDR